jgi:signal transduction histidine kinase
LNDPATPDILADIKAISNLEVIPTILEVICRTTGMGFAAVARVTQDKWMACAVRDDIQFGLQPGGELKLETTICHEIRQHRQPVVIDHVAEDDTYSCHHALTLYGFQSYISVPIIRRDGSFFGTLCAIDLKPAKLNNPETISMFKLYADLISFHLNAIEQLAFAETRLEEERKTAELREQFIAILGHDLRNPAGAVSNVAQLLLEMPLDERVKSLVNIVQNASYRMRGLIGNILDFAHGRMGDGVPVVRNSNEPLEEILMQVITELKTVWPERIIETQLDITSPVNCDGKRIAQLFSNLLGNAITHGQPDMPVKVQAHSNRQGFELSVSNSGEMPADVMERLFQPFYRSKTAPTQHGLGLGLYIAFEIARAHGGSLEVASAAGETRFILKLPSTDVSGIA